MPGWCLTKQSLSSAQRSVRIQWPWTWFSIKYAVQGYRKMFCRVAWHVLKCRLARRPPVCATFCVSFTLARKNLLGKRGCSPFNYTTHFDGDSGQTENGDCSRWAKLAVGIHVKGGVWGEMGWISMFVSKDLQHVWTNLHQTFIVYWGCGKDGPREEFFLKKLNIKAVLSKFWSIVFKPCMPFANLISVQNKNVHSWAQGVLVSISYFSIGFWAKSMDHNCLYKAMDRSGLTDEDEISAIGLFVLVAHLDHVFHLATPTYLICHLRALALKESDKSTMLDSHGHGST